MSQRSSYCGRMVTGAVACTCACKDVKAKKQTESANRTRSERMLKITLFLQPQFGNTTNIHDTRLDAARPEMKAEQLRAVSARLWRKRVGQKRLAYTDRDRFFRHWPVSPRTHQSPGA